VTIGNQTPEIMRLSSARVRKTKTARDLVVAGLVGPRTWLRLR